MIFLQLDFFFFSPIPPPLFSALSPTVAHLLASMLPRVSFPMSLSVQVYFSRKLHVIFISHALSARTGHKHYPSQRLGPSLLPLVWCPLQVVQKFPRQITLESGLLPLHVPAKTVFVLVSGCVHDSWSSPASWCAVADAVARPLCLVELIYLSSNSPQPPY